MIDLQQQSYRKVHNSQSYRKVHNSTHNARSTRCSPVQSQIRICRALLLEVRYCKHCSYLSSAPLTQLVRVHL
jgi:hypothetical protein